MKIYKNSTLAALFLSLSLHAGVAGPLVDLAEQAEKRAEVGDTGAALVLASELTAQIWDASTDIGIRDTLLVSEPAAGFGLYNPRSDNKYKTGDPIFVYAEPFGFAYGSGGEGLYTIDFAVDLRVISDKGMVMGDVTDVTTLELTSRYKLREFQANLTYNLSGIPAGTYILETTLRDKNSSKVGNFQNEVEFTD